MNQLALKCSKIRNYLPIITASAAAFMVGRLSTDILDPNDNEAQEMLKIEDSDLDTANASGEDKTLLIEGYEPEDETTDAEYYNDEVADELIESKIKEIQAEDASKEAEQLLASITDLLTEINNVDGESNGNKPDTIKRVAANNDSKPVEHLDLVPLSQKKTTQDKTKSKLPVKEQQSPKPIQKPLEEKTPSPAISNFSGIIDHKVVAGENLTTILIKHNVKNLASEVVEVLKDRRSRREFSRLTPGEVLKIKLSNGTICEITIINNNSNNFSIIKNSKGRFYIKNDAPKPTSQKNSEVKVITIPIHDNFYSSAADNGLNPQQARIVIKAFSNKINFSKDIRNNDIFKVVLDKSELVAVSYEGKLGKIAAYKNKDGMFYSAEGANSSTPGFLRKPLAAYRRISSRFNKNRLHPVTKRPSPHNGTDFAAPVGTPVFAGTSGTVIISKHKRLNGNYIVIKNGKYLTKYLHLSERKVKKGDRVQVGDEIGAVGNTGRSTGPHLHYEFHINGVPQDVLTVKIPSNLKGADRSSGEINNLIDKYKQFL